MAKYRSEDPVTKVTSGKILDPQTRERLIPLNRLDPALYRIVLLMDEEGSISDPKPFNLVTGGKAFRIVKLDEQIPEHVANIDQDYERIKSIALQQNKRKSIYRIEELKSEVYIEYRIPMPGLGKINGGDHKDIVALADEFKATYDLIKKVERLLLVRKNH